MTSRRPYCDACALPLRACVCALVTRVGNEVEVLVLQHPAEASAAKGTARLLRLGLARCRVVVGERFEPEVLAALLDGTWRKSLRMLHANPLLQALPRWSLAPGEPSRYGALRKAALPTQLSTLEAACAALADIEAAPARYRPLLASLDRFIDDRARFAARP